MPPVFNRDLFLCYNIFNHAPRGVANSRPEAYAGCRAYREGLGGKN